MLPYSGSLHRVRVPEDVSGDLIQQFLVNATMASLAGIQIPIEDIVGARPSQQASESDADHHEAQHRLFWEQRHRAA